MACRLCVLFSSAAGRAYWPTAIRCPSLGPFSSIGGGAHRPLTTPREGGCLDTHPPSISKTPTLSTVAFATQVLPAECDPVWSRKQHFVKYAGSRLGTCHLKEQFRDVLSVRPTGGGWLGGWVTPPLQSCTLALLALNWEPHPWPTTSVPFAVLQTQYRGADT